MSTVDEDYEVSICANCGKGEEESDKLKACMACKMVKYCSRECQIAHRPKHKKECRKRAAELHDEKLFKQPPPGEDCAICFLRLPSLHTGIKYQPCCGKMICSGCILAPVYDDQGNVVENKCPFCRTLYHTSDEEMVEREKKRVEAGDSQAMYNIGCDYRDEKNGYTQNYTKALELFHRAAELGHSKAYNSIGIAYQFGNGVEVDIKKASHYYELSAMMGNASARHNLGSAVGLNGNMNRALKHYMIAVGGGYAESLTAIQKMHSTGLASKEEYTSALQSYQAYLSEIKSPQRDKAAAFSDEYRYY